MLHAMFDGVLGDPLQNREPAVDVRVDGHEVAGSFDASDATRSDRSRTISTIRAGRRRAIP
jgi:hypothetical protein